MTAPLIVRRPDGEQRLVAECVPIDAHLAGQPGLVWFEPYWHIGGPERGLHWLSGEPQGDGPWKIADHIFQVLGCHGSHPELAAAHAAWQDFLQNAANDYPEPPLIDAIARHYIKHIRSA